VNSDRIRAKADIDADTAHVILGLPSGERRCRIAAPGYPLTAPGEIAAAMGLHLAMTAGLPLVIDHPIDWQFAANLDRLQDIYRLWFDRSEKVPIEPSGTYAAHQAAGMGSFFSGGIDSSCTVLRHLDDVTHLVFAWGFDFRRPSNELRVAASRSMRQLADGFRKSLVEVDTDARLMLDEFPWTVQTHGAVMAAVALALQGNFGAILIPSSHSYRDLFPWASHVLTDALWSTSGFEVIHDGAELTRVDKAAVVARSDLALAHLRVCPRDAGSRLNCGRCQKCIRSAINLAAVGALDRCPTLPSNIRRSDVRRIELNENSRSFMAENLSALQARGQRPELQTAIRHVMYPPWWRRIYYRAYSAAGKVKKRLRSR
jgi:hypothetical protein